MCVRGFPEEILLINLDNKVEEFERPILGGIDTVTCEALRFMLETPDDVVEMFSLF